MRLLRWLSLLLAGAGVGCTPLSAPSDVAIRMAALAEPTPIADPGFLQPAATFPGILNPQVRLEVRRGVAAEGIIYYDVPGTLSNSDAFLRFKVRKQSLRNCTGCVFGPNGTLTITMTLVDAARGIVEFQPAGLRFNPDDLPTLTMSFRHGALTAGGAPVTGTTLDLLRIGRQETGTAPWEILASTLAVDELELSAKVPGFTRYAIIY